MKIETTVSTTPTIQIEDFRGDFTSMAALIQESWKENGKQGLLYTSEFLASCLEYPGTNYSLAPTLYQGDIPRAFVAGFPRTVIYEGRQLRVILCTLLSVSSEYKKTGYGVVLWSELVKRAQAAGYDGMVNYCVEGEPMNGMILGCCRMLKLPTERIFSVHYSMRLLQAKSASPAPDEQENAAEIFARIADCTNDAPLKRIWTPQEIAWQLTRHGALFASHRVGAREGLITGYLMHAANSQKTKCLLIEDVLWGTLHPEERLPLAQKMLTRAAEAGAQLALLPILGYADLEPFRAARFRSSPRVLHSYLTIFRGESAPKPVSSMYLDVI